MPFTTLSNRLGILQGRLVPTGFTPTGTYAFVLGSDLAGVSAKLNIGDYVEVSQSANLTGLKYLRFRFRGRPPASLPVGATWKVSMRVAGVELASHIMEAGRQRDRNDLAANVAALSGSQQLSLRLEVIAA